MKKDARPDGTGAPGSSRNISTPPTSFPAFHLLLPCLPGNVSGFVVVAVVVQATQ